MTQQHDTKEISTKKPHKKNGIASVNT